MAAGVVTAGTARVAKKVQEAPPASTVPTLQSSSPVSVPNLSSDFQGFGDRHRHVASVLHHVGEDHVAGQSSRAPRLGLRSSVTVNTRNRTQSRNSDRWRSHCCPPAACPSQYQCSRTGPPPPQPSPCRSPLVFTPEAGYDVVRRRIGPTVTVDVDQLVIRHRHVRQRHVARVLDHIGPGHRIPIGMFSPSAPLVVFTMLIPGSG